MKELVGFVSCQMSGEAGSLEKRILGQRLVVGLLVGKRINDSISTLSDRINDWPDQGVDVRKWKQACHRSDFCVTLSIISSNMQLLT